MPGLEADYERDGKKPAGWGASTIPCLAALLLLLLAGCGAPAGVEENETTADPVASGQGIDFNRSNVHDASSANQTERPTSDPFDGGSAEPFILGNGPIATQLEPPIRTAAFRFEIREEDWFYDPLLGQGRWTYCIGVRVTGLNASNEDLVWMASFWSAKDGAPHTAGAIYIGGTDREWVAVCNVDMLPHSIEDWVVFSTNDTKSTAKIQVELKRGMPDGMPVNVQPNLVGPTANISMLIRYPNGYTVQYGEPPIEDDSRTAVAGISTAGQIQVLAHHQPDTPSITSIWITHQTGQGLFEWTGGRSCGEDRVVGGGHATQPSLVTGTTTLGAGQKCQMAYEMTPTVTDISSEYLLFSMLTIPIDLDQIGLPLPDWLEGRDGAQTLYPWLTTYVPHQLRDLLPPLDTRAGTLVNLDGGHYLGASHWGTHSVDHV